MNACEFYEGLILTGTIRIIKKFMVSREISFLSTYKVVKIGGATDSHHVVEYNGEIHTVIYRNGIFSLTIGKINICNNKKFTCDGKSIPAVAYTIFYGSVGKLRQCICTGDFLGMISFFVSTEDFKKEFSEMKKLSLC